MTTSGHENVGQEPCPRSIRVALAAVPWALWAIPLLGLGALIAAMVMWDGSGELKAAAGVTVAWVGIPVLFTLMCGFRSFRRVLAFGGGRILLASALSIYIASYLIPLGLGSAWPVNAWRDLLADSLVIVDVVESKRLEFHIHGEDCTRTGLGTMCFPETWEYHHYLTVAGREWSVSERTFGVVREGEFVEMAYNRRSKQVLYVAYGSEIGAARTANQVRVGVGLDEPERQVFEDFILPRFKEQSGIDVTFVQMQPGALLEVVRAGAGNPFDLLATDNNQLGSLVEFQLVQDLTVETGRIPSEVLPSMLAVTRFGDRTFFFPFRPNVQIIYYDEARLREAGFAPPLTWDGLYSTAKGLVDAGAGKRVVLKGFPGGPNSVQVVEFLWQAGGDPLVLNDAGSKRAFQFLQQLYPYLSDKTKDAKFDTMNDYLLEGVAYLAPNWTFGISEVVKGRRQDIKAYSGWSGPAGEVHVLGGDVLAIPSRSTNRDEALQFAEYLMSQEVQSVLARELSWPSIRGDAYDNIRPELRPHRDAINEALSKARARPNVPYWNEVEQILSNAWNDIVVNKMDVSSRLDYYAERLDEAREQHALE